MKLVKVLSMLAVASFCLMGCASKCDYAKFHDEAVKAAEKAKSVKFSKVVVKGTYVDSDNKKQSYDDVKVEFDSGVFASTNITHLDEVAVALILNALTAQNVSEDESCTYYAGSSFKVVTESDNGKSTVEYNKYGLLTLIKDADSNLKVSYSK